MRVFLPLLACCHIAAFAQNAPAPSTAAVNPLELTSLSQENSDNKPDDIPFDVLKTFVDVFDTIKNSYVDQVDNRNLIEGAIRGMLTRLDPHSAYMNESEYQSFTQSSEGQYAGLGMVLDIKAGSASVISAIDGSPAAKAGITTGDIISQVDGKIVAELSLYEIDNLLSGEIGSTVNLTIVRGDTVQQLSLMRELVHANSVSSRMLNLDYAYVRITQFQEDTAEALAKEIQALHVKYQVKGMVLDLRDNPGGIFQSAIDSADLFLSQGIIVSIRGRDVDQEEFIANEGDALNHLPIVVIVNGGTASAAEILAGALQDNQRALIIGQQTFGKGTVQSVAPLYHGGAVKLTTARYYTPSGTSIQAAGISPQVILSPLKVNQQRQSNNDSERNLPNHLPNQHSAAKIEGSASNHNAAANLAEQDFALYEALNILTTMSILQNTASATSTEENLPKSTPFSSSEAHPATPSIPAS